MIVGVVNQVIEARVMLVLSDITGIEHDIEAVIDTGFMGELTLPRAILDRLRPPQLREATIVLANRTRQQVGVYAAIIEWDRRRRSTDAHHVEGRPLVGMKLLQGYDLRVRAIPDGRVEIEAIP